MRLIWALGALVAVAGGVQSELETKLKKLQPLVGEWDLTVRLLEPRELSGEMKGTVSAKWAMNKTHVQLTAKMHRPPATNGGSFEGVGYVTFDDNAAYPNQAYRGIFLWEGDGRVLPLSGGFIGSKLVMSGSPLLLEPKDNKGVLRTTTTFKGKDAIEVEVDGVGEEGKSFRLATLSFRRRS